jgi:type IV secretion system protein VirD4
LDKVLLIDLPVVPTLIELILTKGTYQVNIEFVSRKPFSNAVFLPKRNRTRPLVRMILNQVVRRLTEVMKFKMGRPQLNYRHRLLLLLDEFPALGRLDAFETALAHIAGYGLKALLIIQSLNQLTKTYSQSNSIVDNCHIRVVYTPNDEKTPEFISKLLGTKTEVVEPKVFRATGWRRGCHG